MYVSKARWHIKEARCDDKKLSIARKKQPIIRRLTGKFLAESK